MKKIVLIGLMLSGCYHMRNARFVDASESESSAWICVNDDDATNPGGIACGDMGVVLEHMRTPGIPLPDGGVADM